MELEQQISLQPYNTFGVEARAAYFVKIKSTEHLQNLLTNKIPPVFILGGGSNLLLTQDIEQLVLKNEIKGVQIDSQSATHAVVKVGGGENWHEFTQWCLKENLGGIENLSLIPGTVGAAPIQNIGAYGVELKDVFIKLEAVELQTGKFVTFTHSDCRFGYRDSIFKNDYKGKYFITHIYLKLTRHQHRIDTSYGAIQQILEQKGITEPTIREVSEAVIAIRSSKLPDPARLGNSGSFFKNPVIPNDQLLELQKNFPGIVSYPVKNDQSKVPAGWLIEQCGWKGRRVGNTGAHKHQALVLVNYGGATGQEILALAREIGKSVEKKFGIKLQTEVNII